ncbi:hypothetical protein HETIRDRAFT_44209 [Heterobasidion irregulare TC 32-1]|uniref:CHCH domain-containing protein n=1 Tax=Heterobasidion irregulare (strain TC 32-1) TaxID=747525 RepID=W4KI02_HETIT|nr:uncharacterized protein HETIRDRAFT_44209 [Heterobasidion irregulare TC 32-1]ETW85472.1 hypothetical protein HETIRDRAFT_44209 [Heterobasidion irregulare TC 32-1]
MHIKNLKVRPQKNTSTTLCAPELAQMLGCWAATKDHLSVDKCASAATTLFECMRTTPFKTKKQRPTINYHLARLGKHLK